MKEAAIEWWGKAGQRSLERSALVEAVEQFTRALKLIADLPSTPLLRRVASYQERRLVQPPGGHQPAVDLISPLAPMYGRHGSS